MKPVRILLCSTALAGVMAGAAQAQSLIDNGLIALGVNPQGNLIVSSESGFIGLTYIPTFGEALAPGCFCEGWGVADLGTDYFGKAGEAFSDANLFNANLTVDGTGTLLGSAGSSAVASVDVGNGDKILNVTHAYSPAAATANLYQVDVTITNIGTESIVRLVYRRAMDWDVPPTEFDEFVTIQGTSATNLIFSSDNGFADGNPNVPAGSVNPETVNTDFVDNGPSDHGAVFDFDFGGLAPGEVQTFTIYYGAAGSEAEALAALAAVGAEVYSLGQPDTEGGATEGTPNTFIFAFAGVGGTPINGGGSNPHGFLNVYRDVAALIMNSHRRVVGQFTTVDPGARIAVEQVARMSENSQVMSLDASLGKIPLRVYGAVNGEFGNFDRKGSSAGFDYTGGGVTIGADYQLPAGMVGGADIAVGAAFSFQRVSADVDANAGDVDADGYTGSIYAYGAAPMGGMGQLHGELGFSLGYIDYDQTRVSGGQVFSGDPDGMVFSADLEVGYQFDKFPVDEGLGVDLQAGPFVGLSYGFNDVDSFTESGGLAVSSFDDDRLVTTLGGRVSLSKEAEGNIYFGMLEATYNHDFLADGQSVAINGGALTSLLSSPDDDFIGLRALGGVSLNERLRVMLEYNGGYASNSTQHGFLGRLDYAF